MSIEPERLTFNIGEEMGLHSPRRAKILKRAERSYKKWLKTHPSWPPWGNLTLSITRSGDVLAVHGDVQPLIFHANGSISIPKPQGQLQ